MKRDTTNALIGGEAGQGIVTIGGLLSKALVRSGYYIVVTQSYQSRIRGGHNTYAVRFSTDKIEAPQEGIDILVALDHETIEAHKGELNSGSVIIINEKEDIKSIDRKSIIRVPYEKLGSAKLENTISLGVAAATLGIGEDILTKIVDETFKKKGDEIKEANHKALISAINWCKGLKSQFKTPSAKKTGGDLVMNGNEAIALGAISAGLKFYFFYPMTPSTSISLNLASETERAGMVIEQAEDEISAVNMAIGASFAGARSMTATSGGGFALMVEGVSLAGMTETPLVIVVAQRPGPATGLPTRTEQADLEFVLHAGHGEFPRAIFSPGSVEECFHLTRKAFEVAEASQGPVFILTDQFLSDSYRRVAPFDIEKLKPINNNSEIKSSGEYKRFALTKSGVSPRLLPGLSKNLVVVDSDEHTEDGHLTEDLHIRKLMAEKRLKKADIIAELTAPPVLSGPKNPDILLLSWGSTKGSVEEAAAKIEAKGVKVATLHFPQVWPIKSSQYLNYLDQAKDVVIIEGNATAQLARLIRSESGFEIKKKILRYDGLPITPEYILRSEVLKW